MRSILLGVLVFVTVPLLGPCSRLMAAPPGPNPLSLSFSGVDGLGDGTYTLAWDEGNNWYRGTTGTWNLTVFAPGDGSAIDSSESFGGMIWDGTFDNGAYQPGLTTMGAGVVSVPEAGTALAGATLGFFLCWGRRRSKR